MLSPTQWRVSSSCNLVLPAKPAVLPMSTVESGVDDTTLSRSSSEASGPRTRKKQMQSRNHQPSKIDAARTSSASPTPATLSLDRRPAILHPSLPQSYPRSLYRSPNTDAVENPTSRCPTSRVNHLHSHGPLRFNRQNVGVDVDR